MTRNTNRWQMPPPLAKQQARPTPCCQKTWIAARRKKLASGDALRLRYLAAKERPVGGEFSRVPKHGAATGALIRPGQSSHAVPLKNDLVKLVTAADRARERD